MSTNFSYMTILANEYATHPKNSEKTQRTSPKHSNKVGVSSNGTLFSTSASIAPPMLKTIRFSPGFSVCVLIVTVAAQLQMAQVRCLSSNLERGLQKSLLKHPQIRPASTVTNWNKIGTSWKHCTGGSCLQPLYSTVWAITVQDELKMKHLKKQKWSMKDKPEKSLLCCLLIPSPPAATNAAISVVLSPIRNRELLREPRP